MFLQRIVTICCLVVAITSEAALPYYYPNPGANGFRSTFGQSGPFPATNGLLTNSYGSPILRGSAILNRNYLPSVESSQQNRFRNQQEPTVNVQKHVYVHVAPPDPQEQQQQQFQQQQRPQIRNKHYKIVFIKIPSYQPQIQQLSQQEQALQEEKTLIYVLVKRPEDQVPIKISQTAHVPVNKPEVYFIKYKTNEKQQQNQQIEGEDNESVVIESAAGRDNNKNVENQQQNEGYRYDRPAVNF